MLSLNSESVRDMIGTKENVPDQTIPGYKFDPNVISERIQELTRAKNLTHKELSERCSFGLSNLKALFAGRVRWNVDHLAEVAAALGVTVRDLLPGAPLPPVPFPDLDTAIQSANAPSALRALADALEAAPGHELDAAARRLLAAYTAKDWPALMRLCADLAEQWGIER